MEKRIFLLLSFFLGVSVFTGCRQNKKIDNNKKSKELSIFAAASLTDSLNDIKKSYEIENPDIRININYDSSGSLKSQIDQKAYCDIFISASNKQMDQLDKDSDKFNSKVAIDSSSRIDLLENEVVLAKKQGLKLGIKSFDDLGKDYVKSVALGNSDVPVGQYSKRILENIGIWDEIKDKINYGSNVREVASWIDQGASDCGIVYLTDAKVFNLDVIAKADEKILDKKVLYPAAMIETSKNKDEAKKFLSYLKGDFSKDIFKKYGFKVN